MSMIPKGGDTVWGGLDWSPEAEYSCSPKKHMSNETKTTDQTDKGSLGLKNTLNFGRIISFGKDVAEAHSSRIERLDFRVMFLIPICCHTLGAVLVNKIDFCVYNTIFK